MIHSYDVIFCFLVYGQAWYGQWGFHLYHHTSFVCHLDFGVYTMFILSFKSFTCTSLICGGESEPEEVIDESGFWWLAYWASCTLSTWYIASQRIRNLNLLILFWCLDSKSSLLLMRYLSSWNSSSWVESRVWFIECYKLSTTFDGTDKLNGPSYLRSKKNWVKNSSWIGINY